MFQFPLNPIVGQTFTPTAGVTFRWNGTAWFLLAGPGAFISQAEADLRYIQLIQKAAANGVATLDGTTKIPLAQLPPPITLVAPNGISAAGTFVDFAIPAGAKRVIVTISNGSTTGGNSWLVQLASGGVVEAAGYTAQAVSQSGTVGSFSLGVGIPSGSAANILDGAITFNLQAAAANRWIATGLIGAVAVAAMWTVMGRKDLAGVLDRVRITTVGGVDTFDSGTFNVSYEF